MTSIIGIFLLSLIFSLIITPIVINIAVKYNIVDIPSKRKVHIVPIPRAGGVAIFLAFYIALAIAQFYPTAIFMQLKDPQLTLLFTGGLFIFFLGLWDDIKGLDSRFKFIVQILIACFAYSGGISISNIGITDNAVNLGWASLPLTVFWFLLIINAINLIDGLDGLAGGISLFSSIILLIICLNMNQLLIALSFAALAGSILGFLRYNFNPASIFMGDSGSYFIGYMLAGLSIMGTLKGSTAVSILIPVIAMGLPLLDTVFSTIRRFLLGQKIFSPDKKHLHHQLLALGLNQRKAVLILYGICIMLGILSILSIHAKDESIALILIVIGAITFLGIRKLGYINYFGMNKIHHWLTDIGDEIGISRERRSFLNLQIEINESKSIHDLWKNICHAINRMEFDMAEIHLYCRIPGLSNSQVFQKRDEFNGNSMTWSRNGFELNQNLCEECFLKMELPLINRKGQSYGHLWLVKDLQRDELNHHTLRRVEHLRRTVLSTLQVLMNTH